MKEILKKKAKVFAVACLSILAVGSIIFVACQDEDEKDNKLDYPLKNTISFVNENNPLNFVGEFHNSVLNEIGDSVQQELDLLAQRPVVSDNELHGVMNNILNEYLEIMGNKHSSFSIPMDSLVSKIEHIYTNMDLDTNESMNQQIILIQNNSSCYDSLMINICNLEQELIDLAQSEDSSNSMAIRNLYCLTIFKYSCAYWHDAIINSENPWHNYINASLIQGTMQYYPNKSLLSELGARISNVAGKVWNWTVNHLGNIVTSVLYTATFDFVAGKICYDYTGTDVRDVVQGQVPDGYFTLSTQMSAGFTALSSALGAYYGWTHPRF